MKNMRHGGNYVATPVALSNAYFCSNNGNYSPIMVISYSEQEERTDKFPFISTIQISFSVHLKTNFKSDGPKAVSQIRQRFTGRKR